DPDCTEPVAIAQNYIGVGRPCGGFPIVGANQSGLQRGHRYDLPAQFDRTIERYTAVTIRRLRQWNPRLRRDDAIDVGDRYGTILPGDRKGQVWNRLIGNCRGT